MNEDILKILDEVGIELKKHQEYISKTNITGAHNFNVFNFLKFGENKMSEILAFFLDPNESHGQGFVFLKIFLEKTLNLNLKIDEKNVIVNCEKIIKNGRRLDIRIHLEDFVIAIENKIWADDQENQLEDYSDWLEKNTDDYKLVYLTPYGKSPKLKSIQKNSWIKLIENGNAIEISYSKDILNLLKLWIKKCKAKRVEYALNDFKEYLHTYFLGERMTNKIKDMIKEIIYRKPEEVSQIVKVYNEVVLNRRKLIDKVYKSCSNNINKFKSFGSDNEISLTNPFTFNNCYVTKLIIGKSTKEIWLHLSQVDSRIILKLSNNREKANFDILSDCDVLSDFDVDFDKAKESLSDKLYTRIEFNGEIESKELIKIFNQQAELLLKKVSDL